MKKKEFIKTVLEQVRCESVREPLEKELAAHIDDQTEAYIAEGAPANEAEEQAVKTMGDPVETGLMLDSVHRPRFPLAAALSAFALLMGTALTEYVSYGAGKPPLILGVSAGIIAAMLFYYIDYTVFLKAPKITYGAAAILLAAAVVSARKYVDYEIARYISYFGGMLLVPFTCGFAFSMRGGGWKRFIAACLFSVIPPVLIGFLTPNISMSVMSGYAALAAMTVIVADGGFKVNKKAAYLFMCLPAAVCTVGAVWFKFHRNFLYPAVYIEKEEMELYHNYVRAVLSGSRLFGKGSFDALGFYENTILMTASRLGLFAAVLLMLLAFSLPALILVKQRQIKNRFGRTASAAIGTVFLFMTVCAVCVNFGIPLFYSFAGFPMNAGSLPNCLASGALIGIFLSVSRRADLMPEKRLENAL